MKQRFVSLVFCLIAFEIQSLERGVWMTISGTRDPYSYQGISNAVFLFKQLGINNIYFSVWDQSMVNFIPDYDFVKDYPFIKKNPSLSIDPLQILIQIAKPLNIKVFAWFQYGFATSYADPTGGPILQARPEWVSMTQDGNITTKNNFQWMNGFHLQVQKFITDLIFSVIKKYKVDGIQGDDRLPAMPSNSGYDKFTKDYFYSQKNYYPPNQQKNQEWVEWRCEILNNFMINLYKAIKKTSPSIQIHMAPSVYPWSKYQYLQDWPNWVSNKAIDVIIPQIYRYDIDSYKQTLSDNLRMLDQTSTNKFYAGVLIGTGSNTTSNLNNLQKELEINRNYSIGGEVFFYHESLKNQQVSHILRQIKQYKYDIF